MHDAVLSDIPSQRLSGLRMLGVDARTALVDALVHDSPVKPFPYGMTSGVAPIALVLGVSPGNGLGLAANDTVGLSGPAPVCGEPPVGMDYVDRRHYWPKVADLCSFLVSRYDRNLSRDDAISLSGHLNLGTGQFGVATANAVELPLVRWVSELLFARLRPRIVVTWGNQSLLRNVPAIVAEWNHERGLRLEWNKPQRRIAFGNYAFRFWRALREDGREIAVVMWPNHPSRPPFSGRVDSPAWTEAKEAVSELLSSEGL